MSLFETTVHHTVQDLDNADYIENHAPFAVEDIANSYLGSGYYFWDNHIDLAHDWGYIHCGNSYVICEGEMKVPIEIFLDLVGSRADQMMMEKYVNDIPGLDGLTLGEQIEFLKKLEATPNNKGIFPFKVIRAIDISPTRYKVVKLKFAEKRNGYTTLNPKMIICLTEKNKLILKSLKIIYPSEYINS